MFDGKSTSNSGTDAKGVSVNFDESTRRPFIDRAQREMTNLAARIKAAGPASLARLFSGETELSLVA